MVDSRDTGLDRRELIAAGLTGALVVPAVAAASAAEAAPAPPAMRAWLAAPGVAVLDVQVDPDEEATMPDKLSA